MSPESNPAGISVDHIGIAVPDLEEAAREYARILDCAPSPVEEVPSEGVRLVFFDLGNSRIELLEPTSPESPVHRFLDRGRAGVHHVALSLGKRDPGEYRARLKSQGLPVIGEIRQGSGGSEVFFLHPRAARGVMFEFVRGGDHAPRSGVAT